MPASSPTFRTSFSLSPLDRAIGGTLLGCVLIFVAYVVYLDRWSSYTVRPGDGAEALTAEDAEAGLLASVKVAATAAEARAEEREGLLRVAGIVLVVVVLLAAFLIVVAADAAWKL